MDTLTAVLVYGGLAGLCVTAVATAITSIVFVISSRRLRANLEREYGKWRK